MMGAVEAIGALWARAPWAVAAAALAACLLLLALWRQARVSGELRETLHRTELGQERLSGALGQLTQTLAARQTDAAATVDRRLGALGAGVQDALGRSAADTAAGLSALRERLATIDRAQASITALSADVLGLQDILANKQARGAFGEIQLREILSQGLPADGFLWQPTLSTGVRPDALLRMPTPTPPMAIDAKFPLEPYQALVGAGRGKGSDAARTAAERAFRTALKTHIRTIAEKYLIEGETAEGALLFLPSEAVFAEIHARFPDLVRDGFAARVWITSPTTCMAVVTLLAGALRDQRVLSESRAIRRELGLLEKDLERMAARVQVLDKHFEAARSDLDGVLLSAEKAGRRAGRLSQLEFGLPENAAETEAATGAATGVERATEAPVPALPDARPEAEPEPASARA